MKRGIGVAGYRSEDEQMEQIRHWWQEYGRSIIIGVIVALVGIVGWQQWHSYQDRQELAASAAYQALIADLGDSNVTAAQKQAKKLQGEHGASPYAVLGAFQMASQYVRKNDLKAAAEELRWALDHTKLPALRPIARLRLARVLLASNETKAALEVAQPAPKGAFASQFQELIGDIHAAQSDRADAIKAYRAALADDPSGLRHELIQAKLNNLGAQAESAL
ncbi:MAG TPA: tetratricopeptide repeat protein [Nitrococcus sp.]|nr:tetratricopeptide repeat protein [Nitrococcus sp.]